MRRQIRGSGWHIVISPRIEVLPQHGDARRIGDELGRIARAAARIEVAGRQPDEPVAADVDRVRDAARERERERQRERTGDDVVAGRDRVRVAGEEADRRNRRVRQVDRRRPREQLVDDSW